MKSKLKALDKYSKTYEITFQMGYYGCSLFLFKDNVELHISHQHNTIDDAINAALQYLDRINFDNAMNAYRESKKKALDAKITGGIIHQDEVKRKRIVFREDL